MRTSLDGTTSSLYTGGEYDTHIRVKVENGDGTLVALEGRYYTVRLNLPNPSEPIGSATIAMVRELTKSGVTESLAPLVEASDLNVLDDTVTYDPLLQLGRQVTVDVHLTTVGAARPSDGSANWYEIFRGIVAKTEWGDYDKGEVTISVNGIGSVLQLAKSEVAYTYDQGTSIETVAQEILDNNGFGALDDFPVTLYFPSATGKVLPNDWEPGLQKTVWSQLWDLAQSMGWICYFKYRGHTAVELVFFEPARTKTTPDMTVTAWDFTQLAIDESEVRNVGYLVYVDGTGAEVMIGPYENTASITKYGGTLGIRRPFWIKLDEYSPIRDGTSAGNMLTAALTDVADPDVVGTARAVPLVFAESGVDLYTIPALARFFDNNQNLALFSNSIVFEADALPESQIGVRAKPSAGSNTWRSIGIRKPREEALITVELATERVKSIGPDVDGWPVWYRELELLIGSSTKSLNIEIGQFVQSLPVDHSGYPSDTIGPWDYDVDVTPKSTTRHTVEDGLGDPYEWPLFIDDGNILPSTTVTITITPYNATGGSGGSGTAGKPISFTVKPIEEYDDVGIRITELTNKRINHNDVPRSSADIGLGGGVTYTRAAFEWQNTEGQDEDISRVQFYLKKISSPTGYAYAEIFADSGGLPTGAALATSELLDVSTLTTGYVLTSLDFSTPYTVTNNTTVHVAIYYPGGDASNYIAAEANATGNSEVYNGSVWSSAAVGSLIFRLFILGEVTYPSHRLDVGSNLATSYAAGLVSLNATAAAGGVDSITGGDGLTATGTTDVTLDVNVYGGSDAGYGRTAIQGDAVAVQLGTGANVAAAGNHDHAGVYQPVDADLTAIAALAGTSGLLRKTALDTWSLDTNTYLTSADLTGYATESWVTTNFADIGHDHDGVYQPLDADLTAIAALATDGLPRRTSGSWAMDNNSYALSSHNHDGVYQPLDADLTAIAGLAGTSGLLRKTATDTWSLDTNTYLTSADLSGYATETWVTTNFAGISHTHSADEISAGTFGYGAYVVRAAAGQDGVRLAGRAGGATSYYVTLTPTTLSGNRTLTLADGDTTLVSGTMASQSWVSTNYQPLDSDLTAIAALNTDGLLRRSSGVWGIDTYTYTRADVAETITAAWTFDSYVTIDNATPRLEFYENDAATDEKRWRFLASAGIFYFRASNDAQTVVDEIFIVDRTGVDSQYFGLYTGDLRLFSDTGDVLRYRAYSGDATNYQAEFVFQRRSDSAVAFKLMSYQGDFYVQNYGWNAGVQNTWLFGDGATRDFDVDASTGTLTLSGASVVLDSPTTATGGFTVDDGFVATQGTGFRMEPVTYMLRLMPTDTGALAGGGWNRAIQWDGGGTGARDAAQMGVYMGAASTMSYAYWTADYTIASGAGTPQYTLANTVRLYPGGLYWYDGTSSHLYLNDGESFEINGATWEWMDGWVGVSLYPSHATNAQYTMWSYMEVGAANNNTVEGNSAFTAWAYNNHTTGTVALIEAVDAWAGAYGTGAVTDAVAVRATVERNGTGVGALSVGYGVLVRAKSGATPGTYTMGTVYGVKIEDLTAHATTAYAIYTGSGDVRFGDNVEIAVGQLYSGQIYDNGTLTAAGTLNVNWENGNSQLAEVDTENGTVNMGTGSARVGTSYTFQVTNVSSTASRTVTWSGIDSWAGDIQPTASIGDGNMTVVQMYVAKDAAGDPWYIGCVIQDNILVPS